MGRHEQVASLAAIDRPGLSVADIGCGAGRTVRALLRGSHPPAVAYALDTGSDLDDDLLHDERVVSRIHDLDSELPLPAASLDRVVSLNVMEHLADPVAHLADLARVVRPGGRVVVAHSDWDTALFTSGDDQLTRRLVDRFVAEVPSWAGRSDGFMGRKLLSLVDATTVGEEPAFDRVGIASWADPHTRFDDGSVAWKVATGMLAAAREDAELAARAAGWLEGIRALARQGRFMFTVTDVAVVLQRR